MRDPVGFLFIGDPHLASRVPGFRCDDYPRAILGKLAWCLRHAREERLVPIVLGDWFHYPRDNANWLLAELFECLDDEVLTIYGNHDCAENALSPDDTLGVLVAARRVRLLSAEDVWRGTVGGVACAVGGSSYRQPIPEAFARDGAGFVAWVTHHDVRFGGYEHGVEPTAIDGVDVVVNGHVHRPYEPVVVDGTTWINPGNIARVKRSDVVRERRPTALRVDPSAAGWRSTDVEVPHEPFDAVFHPIAEASTSEAPGSAFVRGLAELETLRTASGAGLRGFLDENLTQFDAAIADEIRSLAGEVLGDDA